MWHKLWTRAFVQSTLPALYRVGGSLLRACCPAHAQEADRALQAQERKEGRR